MGFSVILYVINPKLSTEEQSAHKESWWNMLKRINWSLHAWCVISDVMPIKEKSTFKLERGGMSRQTDRRRAWLAAASGESTCRYGMDREITSSSLSDLLSLLLVPASSAWQDRACPDHNYALTYLPANHKKTQPSTLPLCPAPPLTSHLHSHSPFIPPYNPNLCSPLKHPLCFHTLFSVSICFAHIKTEEKHFSLFFLILSLFF